MPENTQTQAPNMGEQVIAKMVELAKSTQRDEFICRVMLRRAQQMFAGAVATFDDATVNQVAHPEAWLSLLGGGGVYQLQIFHANNPATDLDGRVQVVVSGNSRERTPEELHALIADPSWVGPRKMSFPQVEKKNGAYSTGPADPFGGPMRFGAPAPGGTAGNGASHTPAGAAGGASASPEVGALLRELEVQRQATARLTLQLETQKHEADLQRERERHERELERLRAEVKAEVASRGAAQPADGGLGQLVTALAKMQEESANRFQTVMLELGKRQDQQAQAQAETNRLLLTKLTEPKPLIDPALLEIIKDQKTASAEANVGLAKMYSGVGEMMGSVMQTALGAVRSMQELANPGDDEPSWVKGLRVAGEFMSVMNQQPPQPQFIPQPQVVAPQPPRRVRPPRVVAPAGAPAAPAPAPAPVAAFNGVDAGGAPAAAAAQVDPSTLSAFDQVVYAIKERQDPVNISNFFIDNSEDPSIQAKLVAANGNPLVAFQPHLAQWLQSDPSNMQYVHTLIQTLQAVYQQRMAAGEAGEEEEEDEGGAEAENGAAPQVLA